MVDAVLEETGAGKAAADDAGAGGGVLRVAMCLFRAGYLGMWEKLTGALGGPGMEAPSEKALREVRRRIGVEPLKALFETLAGPLGQPGTPGARLRRVPHRRVRWLRS